MVKVSKIRTVPCTIFYSLYLILRQISTFATNVQGNATISSKLTALVLTKLHWHADVGVFTLSAMIIVDVYTLCSVVVTLSQKYTQEEEEEIPHASKGSREISHMQVTAEHVIL